MVRMRPRLAGVIEPCLPSPADRAPQEILADTEQVQSKTNGLGVASGEEWLHKVTSLAEASRRLRCRRCCEADRGRASARRVIMCVCIVYR
jgi:hypothetical protein